MSEQESIATGGDNDDGDDSEEDEDEDDNNSRSDSENSTDDEDDDDSEWSGIRDLSWTSKLLSTFNEAKKEFHKQGMTADYAHQEAYQYVLPKLRRNIMSNYVQKIVGAAKLHTNPVHKRSWAPNESYKEMAIMNLKRPWDMQLKTKISHSRGHTGYLLHDAKMSIQWERVSQKVGEDEPKSAIVWAKSGRGGESKSGRGNEKWWKFLL